MPVYYFPKNLFIAIILNHPWLNSVQVKFSVFKEDSMYKLLKQNIFKGLYYKDKDGNINQEDIEEMDFTLRYLDSTLNDNMRNITEESVVKCPFNTTEEKPFSNPLKLRAKLYANKEDILIFEPRARQFDIKYEMDNNNKFDDGVYVTTQQTIRSKAKSGLFSQKSRTRTFTTKKESSRRISTSQQPDDEIDTKNKEIFNMFGQEGIQEVNINEVTKQNTPSKIQLDYNLVYALRRFGYPYDYTIRIMVTKEINYLSAFLSLVKKSKA